MDTPVIKLQPLNDQVLVRRDKAKRPEGSGDLYLPDSQLTPPNSGIVVALPLTGTLVPPIITLGTRVLYQSYSGVEVPIVKDEYYLLIHVNELLAILPQEENVPV